MPAATVLSASPAPGSAARMAGGISASEASRIGHERAARRPPSPCAGCLARLRRGSGPLRTSLVFERPKIDPCGRYFRRALIASIRRFSSAVEQRFCKPKVGSSILSTGTTLLLELLSFFLFHELANSARSANKSGFASPKNRISCSWRVPANTTRLVEKVVAVAERLLCVLVDRNGDRLDVLVAVALARGAASSASASIQGELSALSSYHRSVSAITNSARRARALSLDRPPPS